jgi:hypothetical protein
MLAFLGRLRSPSRPVRHAEAPGRSGSCSMLLKPRRVAGSGWPGATVHDQTFRRSPKARFGRRVPALAASDKLQRAPGRVNAVPMSCTHHGQGEYNAVMPPLVYLSDSDVADTVTFVMNSLGNLWRAAAAEVAAAEAGRDRPGSDPPSPSRTTGIPGRA